MLDVFVLTKKSHRKVVALLKRCDRINARSGRVFLRASERILEESEVHFSAKTAAIYEQLTRARGFQERLAEGKRQQNEILHSITLLPALAADGEAWKRSVQTLLTQLEEHFTFEQQQIIGPARKIVSREQRWMWADIYLAKKENSGTTRFAELDILFDFRL